MLQALRELQEQQALRERQAWVPQGLREQRAWELREPQDGWAPAAAWSESCAARWAAPELRDEPELRERRVRPELQEQPEPAAQWRRHGEQKEERQRDEEQSEP